jgi:hypothetical protein
MHRSGVLYKRNMMPIDDRRTNKGCSIEHLNDSRGPISCDRALLDSSTLHAVVLLLIAQARQPASQQDRSCHHCRATNWPHEGLESNKISSNQRGIIRIRDQNRILLQRWWQPNRISLTLSPYQLKGQSLMVAAPSYHTMGPYMAD